jgi:hypothetical protein
MSADASGEPMARAQRGVVAHAALMGAALAAVVTWVLGEGAWSWSTLPVALTLLAVIAAYHRPPAPDDKAWTGITRSAAFAAVGGLTLALLAAFPLQEWLIEPVAQDDCRIRAMQMFPGNSEAWYDWEAENCAAGLTAQWLTLVWLIAGFSLLWLDRKVLRRIYNSAIPRPQIR